MKSEIVKVKRGPVGSDELTFDQATAKLTEAGWSFVELSEELYCHGLASNGFRHTYTVTLLCTKKDEC